MYENMFANLVHRFRSNTKYGGMEEWINIICWIEMFDKGFSDHFRYTVI